MTKQEEIQERLTIFLKEFAHECEPHCEIEKNEFGEIAGWCAYLIDLLHSQGVVIKVERELPPQNNRCLLWDLYQKGWLDSQQAMKLADYVATEPLIKREANERTITKAK